MWSLQLICTTWAGAACGAVKSHPYLHLTACSRPQQAQQMPSCQSPFAHAGCIKWKKKIFGDNDWLQLGLSLDVLLLKGIWVRCFTQHRGWCRPQGSKLSQPSPQTLRNTGRPAIASGSVLAFAAALRSPYLTSVDLIIIYSR